MGLDSSKLGQLTTPSINPVQNDNTVPGESLDSTNDQQSYGSNSSTTTVYDFNGTSYDTLEQAKQAALDAYGIDENFVFNNSQNNPDAKVFIPGYSDESITEYKGKIRNLNSSRPEILGQVEFRPLFGGITQNNGPMQGSERGVIEKYTLSNSSLVKTNGGRLFILQSHIRLVLQQIIKDMFSSFASFDIEDIMKKISFSQEKKKIFDDIDYNTPFVNVRSDDVIAKISEKDPALAEELQQHAADKYLNLIFVYFLNSSFADKIFKSRSDTRPFDTGLTVDQIDTIEIQLENNSGLGNSFFGYAMIAAQVSNIVSSIKQLTQDEPAVGKPIDMIQLINKINLGDDPSNVPDIVQLHRLLNSLMCSCFGIVVGDGGTTSGIIGENGSGVSSNKSASVQQAASNAASNSSGTSATASSSSSSFTAGLIPFVDVSFDSSGNATLNRKITNSSLSDNLKEFLETDQLVLAKIINKISSLPFAQNGGFNTFGFYKDHILAVKNDFTSNAVIGEVGNLYFMHQATTLGLASAMSPMAADLKYLTKNKNRNDSGLGSRSKSSTHTLDEDSLFFMRFYKRFSYINAGSSTVGGANPIFNESTLVKTLISDDSNLNRAEMLNYRYQKGSGPRNIGAANDGFARGGEDLETSALGKIFYVKNDNTPGDSQSISWSSGMSLGMANPMENSMAGDNKESIAAYTFDGDPKENTNHGSTNVAAMGNQKFHTLEDLFQYEEQHKYISKTYKAIKQETKDLISDFSNTFSLDDNESDIGYQYIDEMLKSIGEEFDTLSGVGASPNKRTKETIYALYIMSLFHSLGKDDKSCLFYSLLTNNYLKNDAAQGTHDGKVEELSQSNTGFPEINNFGSSAVDSRISGVAISGLFREVLNYQANNDEFVNPNNANRTAANPTKGFYSTGNGASASGYSLKNVLETIPAGIIKSSAMSEFPNTTGLKVSIGDIVAREYFRSLPHFKTSDINKCYASGYSKDRNKKKFDSWDSDKKKSHDLFEIFPASSNSVINSEIASDAARSEFFTENIPDLLRIDGGHYQQFGTGKARKLASMINYDKFRQEVAEVNSDLLFYYPEIGPLYDSSFENTGLGNMLKFLKGFGINLNQVMTPSQLSPGTKVVELESVGKFYAPISDLINIDFDEQGVGSGDSQFSGILDVIFNFDTDFLRKTGRIGHDAPSIEAAMQETLFSPGVENLGPGGIGSSSIKRSMIMFELISRISSTICPVMMSIPETYQTNNANFAFAESEIDGNKINYSFNKNIAKGLAHGLSGDSNVYLDSSVINNLHINLAIGNGSNNSAQPVTNDNERFRSKFANYCFGYYNGKSIRESFISKYKTARRQSTALLDLLGKVGGIYGLFIGDENELPPPIQNITPHTVTVPDLPDVFDNLIGLQSEIQYLGYPIMKRKLLRQSIESFYLPTSKSIAANQVKAAINYFSFTGKGHHKPGPESQRGGKLIFHVGIPVDMIHRTRVNRPISLKILRTNHKTQKTEIYRKEFLFLPTFFYVDNCQVPSDVISRDMLENLSDVMDEVTFLNAHIMKYTSIEDGTYKMRDVRYSEALLGGNSVPENLSSLPNIDLAEIFKNHIADYYLKLYTRMISGLDFDEDVFQITDDDDITIAPGADTSPFLGSSNLAAYFTETIQQNINQGQYDSETSNAMQRELQRLKSEAGRSIFFSPFKYLYRTIRTRAFDRVFSVLVDESDDNFISHEFGSTGEKISPYEDISDGPGSESAVNSYFIDIDIL